MQAKDYIRNLYAKEDAVLASILEGLNERGLPQISVPPEVGKTLYLLAKMSRAKRVLEIGALGGYSTIWLARALPPSGEVVSLELKQEHADFAMENIAKAGLKDRVKIMVGDAKESLLKLIEQKETFDFFFIDADKSSYVNYLEHALQLAESGAIIAADNLFQSGKVFDENNDSPNSRAIRQFNQLIAEDPRLESIILPIGDGLGISIVK